MVWNKGLKGYTNDGSFKKGHKSWNKDLTKTNDIRIAKVSGINHYLYGKKNRWGKHSEIAKEKIRISKIGIKRPDLSRRNKLNSGKKHPLYGTKWKHAPETIQKLKGPRPAISGKNNPKYIDGRSKLRRPGLYGRDWNKIRYEVYKRDKFTCQNCKRKKIKLDVHHIIPWFESKDNLLSNLISLCRKCHTTEDNKWRSK